MLEDDMYRIEGVSFTTILENIRELATGGLREIQNVTAEMPDKDGLQPGTLVAHLVACQITGRVVFEGTLDDTTPKEEGGKVFHVVAAIDPFTGIGEWELRPSHRQ